MAGTRFEEKDLLAVFGETYRRYQARVPAFFPHPKKRLRRGETLSD